MNRGLQYPGRKSNLPLPRQPKSESGFYQHNKEQTQKQPARKRLWLRNRNLSCRQMKRLIAQCQPASFCQSADLLSCKRSEIRFLRIAAYKKFLRVRRAAWNREIVGTWQLRSGITKNQATLLLEPNQLRV